MADKVGFASQGCLYEFLELTVNNGVVVVVAAVVV